MKRTLKMAGILMLLSILFVTALCGKSIGVYAAVTGEWVDPTLKLKDKTAADAAKMEIKGEIVDFSAFGTTDAGTDGHRMAYEFYNDLQDTILVKQDNNRNPNQTEYITYKMDKNIAGFELDVLCCAGLGDPRTDLSIFISKTGTEGSWATVKTQATYYEFDPNYYIVWEKAYWFHSTLTNAQEIPAGYKYIKIQFNACNDQGDVPWNVAIDDVKILLGTPTAPVTIPEDKKFVDWETINAERDATRTTKGEANTTTAQGDTPATTTTKKADKTTGGAQANTTTYPTYATTATYPTYTTTAIYPAYTTTATYPTYTTAAITIVTDTTTRHIHVYTNDCDRDCNECGDRRMAPHTYTDACDWNCDLCGARRTAPHTFTDDCDVDCDLCGEVRVAPHTYAYACDTVCTICGDEREAAHIYSDACDMDCNACGEVRVPPHVFGITCGEYCVYCGAYREAAHDYTSACDAYCNICGAMREAPHEYDHPYDTSCNLCGAARAVNDPTAGDVNADSRVNIRDLGLLQQYLNNWDIAVLERVCDVNADEKVNIRDLGVLQQYLNGWDVELKLPNALKLETDEAKILADAFALGENECTPYIAQLTGKVLQTEAYNEQYGSVTVTIDVNGKTIECYQMKGDGYDKVKPGDIITVKGVIKNYFYEGATKGKVEFAWHEASGTEVQLVKLISVAAQDLSTPEKILAAAQNLKNGESLQKDVTLTGEVLDVETPYDPEYDNVTVNIRVNGVDIKCYRLKGNGVDKVKGGDKITVTGKIKNYNGIIEFDSGCQMTKRVAGKDTSEKLSVVESPKAGVAYKFGMVQPNANKDAVYYLKGGMSGFYMATSSSSAAAVDVYLEETSGGYYLYAMVNGKKQYINMVVSSDDAHINGAYESTAKTVYTYDTTAKTLVAEMTKNGETELYWFGTRNDKSYTTVGPCATEYDGFYCQLYV